MEASEENEKINSNNNYILLEIIKELVKIIEYIQINFIKNKDINLVEIQEKNNIKLGVKRKRLKQIVKNEDLNNKNEINLNENEEKNENDKIVLKNKKLKVKLNKYKRHTNEIIKKVKEILKNINKENNINNKLKKIIDIYYKIIRIKKEKIYENGDKYIGEFINKLI